MAKKRAKKRLRGICPRCFRVGIELTDHHVYPVRWGKRKGNNTKLYLCWQCHKEIDSLLPLYRKMTRNECITITREWLRGNEILVRNIKYDHRHKL